MNITSENSSFSQPIAAKCIDSNSSYFIPELNDLTVADSNWVLTSAFIIFTMQTGMN